MTFSQEIPANIVKPLVEEFAPSVMEKLGLENTEANHEDVLALALNTLPTKYVTTLKGKQYAEMIEVFRVQYETDIIAALTRATIKVKERPRDPVANRYDRKVRFDNIVFRT